MRNKFFDMVEYDIFTWYIICVVWTSFNKVYFVENIVKVYLNNHISSRANGALYSEIC